MNNILARLDTNKTAKPLTRIISNIPNGYRNFCENSISHYEIYPLWWLPLIDLEYEDENGNRYPLT